MTSRPKVFISTDMQMITGVNNRNGDKDDVQSLVHALMYQDKIDIRGIMSSTSRWQPGANDEKFIHHVIDEYAADRSTLEAKTGNTGAFKTAAELHAVTYQGTKKLAASSSDLPSANEATAALIKEARTAKADGEVLYVLTWGGLGDVARALKDAPDIASAIRFISCSGPNQEPDAYAYMKANWAGKGGLWWIDSQTTQRGIYAQEDQRLPPEVTLSQVKEFADGHGNLGTFFYENSQDLRGTGDTYSGLKMSDSNGILYLIDQANNSDPTAESWGGEYSLAGTTYWRDRTDTASKLDWSGSNGARTTYEDRAAWLGDFKARFDWLQKDGASTPETPPTPVPTPTPPTANDTITVRVSGTGYNGDPNFAFVVDGKIIDSTNIVMADYKASEWQEFTFTGNFDADIGAQSHRVGIKFNNDLNGGSRGDRNLYVDQVTFNGEVNTLDAKLTSNGTKYWDFIV
ncbi:DUF1593 domain-containing protein [Microvirga sp. 3-52]|nr:DUF1593 domain-containing protein [Microvirga sp. 3-52]